MEDGKIYFWEDRNGNGVYFNVDKDEAVKDNYTGKPLLWCTLDDWYLKYESTARLEDGKIVLGKSEEQKTAERNARRKDAIVREMNELETKGLRASRAVVLNIATDEDLARLKEIEETIEKLRAEYAEL